MKIKALSLWQPWASLIAVGAKTYETRSWKTEHRGPLLICASKKPFKLGEYPEEFETTSRVVLRCLVVRDDLFVDLPYGEALAIVELVSCIPANLAMPDSKNRLFGDFSAGRYAWKLENVRAIEPFPVKGKQGLFEVEIPEEMLRVP